MLKIVSLLSKTFLTIELVMQKQINLPFAVNEFFCPLLKNNFTLNSDHASKWSLTKRNGDSFFVQFLNYFLSAIEFRCQRYNCNII